MDRLTLENPRGLDDAHYALIGWVIAEWAELQSFLAVVLTELVVGRAIEREDDVLSLSAFIGQDANIQIGLLKVMGQIRLGDADGEAFVKTLDLILGIKSTRDRLAHGRIVPRAKGLGLVVHSLKPIPKMKSEEVYLSHKEIIKTVENLRAYGKLILEILQRHQYMIHWASLRSGTDTRAPMRSNRKQQ